ncbi:MAG: hypothetical protein DMD72_11700 [Gemmatimonadetes bacterium]|nr:MAG: hypothetical protein DMD72_11700 [Gemmatimonadota bacterium]
MLFALYALFFLSGAAGLMYESIWTRYLALLVGHSAYAQILVLTIFLGGMAVGSFIVGRYSERLGNPLVWYAVVEAGVGVLGLLFHPTFRAVSAAAYDSSPVDSAGRHLSSHQRRHPEAMDISPRCRAVMALRVQLF